jgi:hypothetical protein
MEDEETYEEAYLKNNITPHDKFSSFMATDFINTDYSEEQLKNFQIVAEMLFNMALERRDKTQETQFGYILYSIQKKLLNLAPKRTVRRRAVHPPGLGHRSQRPEVLIDNGPPPGLNFDGDGGTRRMRKSKKHTHKKHKSRRHKKSKKHRK